MAATVALAFSQRRPRGDGPGTPGDPPPRSRNGSRRAYDRVYLGIAILIAAVWTVSAVVALIFPTRAVPPTTNYLMMAVAGAFFGANLLSKRSGGDK